MAEEECQHEEWSDGPADCECNLSHCLACGENMASMFTDEIVGKMKAAEEKLEDANARLMAITMMIPTLEENRSTRGVAQRLRVELGLHPRKRDWFGVIRKEYRERIKAGWPCEVVYMSPLAYSDFRYYMQTFWGDTEGTGSVLGMRIVEEQGLIEDFRVGEA